MRAKLLFLVLHRGRLFAEPDDMWEGKLFCYVRQGCTNGIHRYARAKFKEYETQLLSWLIRFQKKRPWVTFNQENKNSKFQENCKCKCIICEKVVENGITVIVSRSEECAYGVINDL